MAFDKRLLTDGVSKRLLADGTSQRQLNTTSSSATAVTLGGPSSGSTNNASTNFTVGANGVITGTVVVTPTDFGAGGTFTPSSVSISAGSPTATFTYTAAINGTASIGCSNNGGLGSPSAVSYTSSASCTILLTAPALLHGLIARASNNFTLSLSGFHAGVTLTPSDGSGGTFSPTTVTLSTGTTVGTFTYTPATAGAKTVSVSTNDASIAAPSSASFTADNPTFYVSAAGSDSNDGQSTATPWLTAAKCVSYGTMRGSTFSFRGGDTFEGTLDLADGDSGASAADLITVNSYGTGQAILTVTTGGTTSTTPVINAINTGGIWIDNLEIVGRATGSNGSRQHLIALEPTAAGSGTKYNLTVSNCKIHKGKRGISGYEYRIWQSPSVVTTSVKVDGLTIRDNEVYDCWDEAITIRRYRLTAGTDSTWIKNLSIYRNHVHDSGANLEANGVSSGIVTSCCEGASGGLAQIYGNVIHDIGTGSTLGCGAAYYSQICKVRVFANEIYNIFGAAGDAAAIDFDTGTFDSVAEYNYCHDCDGPGWIAYMPIVSGGATASSVPFDNNVVRYNVFQDCGKDTRAGGWPSLSFHGETFSNTYVYNNTFIMTAHSNAAFIRWDSTCDGNTNFHCYNNIFYGIGNVQMIDIPSGTGIEASHYFKNNAYYPASTGMINWFGASYNTVAAWVAAATNKDTGAVTADPSLVAPGTAVVYNDASLISGFGNATPVSGASPVVDAGLDLTASPYSYAGITLDYAQNVALTGSAYDIGALEYGSTPPVSITFVSRRNQSGINFFGSRR